MTIISCRLSAIRLLLCDCSAVTAALRQRPLWWLTPPPLPRWEACHWIFGSLRFPTSSAVTDSLDFQVALLPYKSSSLVQLQFLCHPAKAGALWTLGDVPHVSAGKHKEIYSATRRGEVRRSRIGGSGQRPLFTVRRFLLMNLKVQVRISQKPKAGS